MREFQLVRLKKNNNNTIHHNQTYNNTVIIRVSRDHEGKALCRISK